MGSCDHVTAPSIEDVADAIEVSTAKQSPYDLRDDRLALESANYVETAELAQDSLAEQRGVRPAQQNGKAGPRGETGVSTGADGGSAPGPLPDGMAEVWAALQGKLLTAKQLGQALGITAEAVRKRIKQLNERRHAVKNTRGAGYYRPDAPPPDLAPPRAADRTSG